MKKAYIINIGDELLSGKITNTNGQWISEKLAQIGIEVVEQRVTSDNEEFILDALNDAHQSAKLVFMTGGLGPTKDDITKQVLAKYFNTKLVFIEEVFKNIQAYFNQHNIQVTKAHKEQSYLPEQATLFTNEYGTAPGMMMKKGNVTTFSMPGVPYEMKHLMEDQIIPMVKQMQNDQIVESRAIHTVGVAETDLSERLEKIESEMPSHVKAAYLPYLAEVCINVTVSGKTHQIVRGELDHWTKRIKGKLGDFVYGEGEDNLAFVLQKTCIEKGLMVATAESCTGGSIAKLLTSNPGSSKFFSGSVVAYSDNIKEQLLSVPESTIQIKGAVSEETVRYMVKGILKTMQADIGIATSGIAGPGGGSDQKPVGTVWLACGDRNQIKSQKLQLNKDRTSNIEYSSIMALNLLRHFLMGV